MTGSQIPLYWIKYNELYPHLKCSKMQIRTETANNYFYYEVRSFNEEEFLLALIRVSKKSRKQKLYWESSSQGDLL